MADRRGIREDDIVQITDEEHHWYPCLLIVDEVKPWGVVAYVLYPTNSEPLDMAYFHKEAGKEVHVGIAENKTNRVGESYIRIASDKFEAVGIARVTRG